MTQSSSCFRLAGLFAHLLSKRHTTPLAVKISPQWKTRQLWPLVRQVNLTCLTITRTP